MLTDDEIMKIEEEVNHAIKHLQTIRSIAETKDSNVEFLADYMCKDIEKIVSCVKLKGHNMPL